MEQDLFQINIRLAFHVLMVVSFIQCKKYSDEERFISKFINEVEVFKHDMKIVNIDFSEPIRINKIDNIEYDTSEIIVLGCYHISNLDTFWIYTKVEKSADLLKSEVPIFTSENIDYLRK